MKKKMTDNMKFAIETTVFTSIYSTLLFVGAKFALVLV